MAYNYIDTPRTEMGNATYITNGLRSTTRHNLSALDSMENSFQSPSKDGELLKTEVNRRNRKNGDFSLRTPRAGAPPSSKSRRNLPTTAPPKGEFTPLMKSVTKGNLLRGSRKGGPQTPAYLRNDYRDPNTPGLPKMEQSEIYEDFSMNEDDPTPVPQIASSSPQSTPLPVLPGRNVNGGVIKDENVMTLKEQENVINKLDKENFDLKLRITFLQEKLNKAGPDLNRTALEENIELKVSGKTMERELLRCKHNLARAQRKAEACQRELESFQEKWKRRQADGTLQKELDWMKEDSENKDIEINELREELRSVQSKESDEIQDLRDKIGDLEYTIREKDTLLEKKEEEVGELKEKEQEGNGSLTELEAELERARTQVNEFKEIIKELRNESKDTETACQRAVEEKNRAIEDLRELQDEMANKSFYTKGLSRQLEDKANSLENEVTMLRRQYRDAQEELETQKRLERHLQQQIQELQQDLDLVKAKSQDEIEIIQHERDVVTRERDLLSSQLRETDDELRARGDAKSLLQTRHDALTSESQGLQKELDRARVAIADLEQQVVDEKRTSFENFEELKAQHKDNIDQLRDDIESLQRNLEDNRAHFEVDRDKWESARRSLELQKHQAEQQAGGYKRTIERLHQAETSLSGKEKKFQDIINSEKLQHSQEKELLNRQITELNSDIVSRREVTEKQRLELLTLKEELRVAKREGEAMKETVQNLNDDVIVLQASLEEERQLGKSQQRTGPSELEKQLQNITIDRQTLRDKLVNTEFELGELRAIITDIKAEREELKSQLGRTHNQLDETYRLDQEKLDLRKSKLRHESEVKRLKEEKDVLLEAKETLRIELDVELERAADEENRLLAQIDQLQDKLFISSEKRDRELASSRLKSERLEKRVKDLESILDQQVPTEIDTGPEAVDSSILRHHLQESRKKEKAALRRESDLKSSVRQLKDRIANLETENHELQTDKFGPISSEAGISPSSRYQEEVRKLRGQLLDAHKNMKGLRAKNHDLQRHAVMAEERKDLHELLKSATLEAESLSVKLSERDVRVNELRAHLRRVREERTLSKKQADTADNQLQALQEKYGVALDDLACQVGKGGRHEKELRGLGKEIMWLRAKLSREERFRRDLAWGKGIMEVGERIRIACNEMDLQLIADMGVEAGMAETKLCGRRKLRSAAFVVMAAARMQKMAAEWRKTRKMGEGLRKAKNDVLKRRGVDRMASTSEPGRV
ncbi:hypothetical protein LOZ37_001222 [Ophidiomyces ophidiicola]|nr:hypothetical protein LOZ37_001222 [Ophidiomyces ophidiicola]